MVNCQPYGIGRVAVFNVRTIRVQELFALFSNFLENWQHLQYAFFLQIIFVGYGSMSLPCGITMVVVIHRGLE